MGNLSGVRAVGGVGGQDLGGIDRRGLVVVGGGACNEGSGGNRVTHFDWDFVDLIENCGIKDLVRN